MKFTKQRNIKWRTSNIFYRKSHNAKRANNAQKLEPNEKKTKLKKKRRIIQDGKKATTK